ncbi:MAG: transglutaminase family protein, partial [Frankiales bacterium]|nr:transglutaminase family protein [Frankiales bacterium]
MRVDEPSEVVLQVAVTDPAASGSLVVVGDTGDIGCRVVDMPGSGPAHVFTAPLGRIEVSYQATVEGERPPEAVTQADAIAYSRPSRYAES